MQLMVAGHDQLQGGNRISEIVEILHGVPFEVAANIKVARDIGTAVFIACRESESDDVNLHDLKELQDYEILVGTANSIRYDRIGLALDIPDAGHSVGLRVDEICEALEVDSTEEAGSFIPIDEARLREVQLYKRDDHGNRVPKLSPHRSRILDMVSDGLSTMQISKQLGCFPGSVAEARRKIRAKLGLKDNMELRRVAGALKNLEQYADEVGIVANTLQPKIEEVIEEGKRRERTGVIDLAAEVVQTSQDSRLLQELARQEFISKQSATTGDLSLVEWVTATLFREDYEAREVMQRELTRTTAQTVIAQEVQYFLDKRET
jgi:DNA-binding CsgD family transcriptional regulator